MGDNLTSKISETLMRTFLEQVVGQGQLELIDELANADMIDEANLAFGGPAGRDGLVAHVKGFRRNIGEANIAIQRIVGNNQSVMAWWSFEGKHNGPWLNQQPTGKSIRATVFSFFDLEEGKISRYQLFLTAELPEVVTFDTSRHTMNKS